MTSASNVFRSNRFSPPGDAIFSAFNQALEGDKALEGYRDGAFGLRRMQYLDDGFVGGGSVDAGFDPCAGKARTYLARTVADEGVYEFKAIVTDKRTDPCDIAAFHEGRGSQEGIFAETRTHRQMGYVPVGTRVGNQLHMFAGILVHNLTCELQVPIGARARGTNPKRAALWYFREMETLRRNFIRCTGRVIRPAGKPVISINSNDGRESRVPTCPHSNERRRLIDPSLRRFMQQSGSDNCHRPQARTWPCGRPRAHGFPRRPRADRLPSGHSFRTP